MILILLAYNSTVFILTAGGGTDVFRVRRPRPSPRHTYERPLRRMAAERTRPNRKRGRLAHALTRVVRECHPPPPPHSLYTLTLCVSLRYCGATYPSEEHRPRWRPSRCSSQLFKIYGTNEPEEKRGLH